MLEGRICKKGVKHFCECRITHVSGTVSALAKFQARNCSFRGFDSSFPHPSTLALTRKYLPKNMSHELAAYMLACRDNVTHFTIFC